MSKDDSKPWTREQYDLMQVHAHELGYHLITPFRKGLKNIRVGVITAASPDLKPSETGKNATPHQPQRGGTSDA